MPGRVCFSGELAQSFDVADVNGQESLGKRG